MLHLIADENFDNKVLRGLFQANAGIDVVRVQDVGLLGATDSEILAWAAQQGRVLLTHAIKTVPDFAYDRVRQGQPMLGVVAIGRDIPIGKAIDDILLLATGSLDGEWEGQVVYLPL